jgi:hypothetical protein
MQNQCPSLSHFKPYFSTLAPKTGPHAATEPGYQPVAAWFLAECSKLAYSGKETIAGTLKDAGFERLIFFDTRGTQAYLAIHPGDGNPFAVLAFRGTEKNHLDILTDIIILKTKMPDMDDAYADQRYFAHGGFVEAYRYVCGNALAQEVLACFPETLPQGNEANSEPWVTWPGMPGISNAIQDYLFDDGGNHIPLFVTGHSLGGALATLAAYHIVMHYRCARVPLPVYLYTLGSPRVVNKAFARHMDEKLSGRAYRCVHRLDIVPRVPVQMFNYEHIHNLIFLDADSQQGQIETSKAKPGDWLVILRCLGELTLGRLTFGWVKRTAFEDHRIDLYIQALKKAAPKHPGTPATATIG